MSWRCLLWSSPSLDSSRSPTDCVISFFEPDQLTSNMITLDFVTKSDDFALIQLALFGKVNGNHQGR